MVVSISMLYLIAVYTVYTVYIERDCKIGRNPERKRLEFTWNHRNAAVHCNNTEWPGESIFDLFIFQSQCVVCTYARHGEPENAKGSLSRRLRAGKNTRRVYAVKKHDGARRGSFTKLIDANDALIVLPPPLADSRFTPLSSSCAREFWHEEWDPARITGYIDPARRSK